MVAEYLSVSLSDDEETYVLFAADDDDYGGCGAAAAGSVSLACYLNLFDCSQL